MAEERFTRPKTMKMRMAVMAQIKRVDITIISGKMHIYMSSHETILLVRTN